MHGKMDNKNYSEYWVNQESVKLYIRKMSTKIERLRHLCELNIIKNYAKGNLYDCSIGEGRFIRFLKVKYSGSDYSGSFTEYVKNKFPDIKVSRNDLRNGINEKSNS